jgi:aspartate/methionine/tyrosine aminotransferase
LIEWVIENHQRAKYILGFSEVLGGEDTWSMVDWDPVMEELARHHGKAWDSQREVERRLPGLLGVPEGETLLTQGTSEANSLVMHLLCTEGSTVVVDVPAYQPIPDVPQLYGARTVAVPRRMEEGWRLDLQRMQESVGRDTAAIFTVNLHNPTGAALRREELRALADIAADAGANLVVDEIFRPFVEDDREVPPVREVAPEAVSTGSVSKAYVWSCTRMGWISAPMELIQEASRLRDLVEPTIAAPGIAAAPQVLDRMDELRARARAIAWRNMGTVRAWVESRDDVSWVPPHAGIICFPRFEGVEDTIALAKRAMDEHAVLTSPGEYFGLPGHLRIGVGHPDVEHVAEGLHLLGETLDSHGTG